MAGRMITPVSTVRNMILTDAERKTMVLINVYCYAGELAVQMARTAGNYRDITGNLRSSVGYVVLNNGKVIQSASFQQVKQGKQGVADGNKFMNELIKKNRKGIRLIVVAGMNYAAIVEDKHLKKVVKFTESVAKDIAENTLKQLGFKL